jgi:hypothetical protein
MKRKLFGTLALGVLLALPSCRSSSSAAGGLPPGSTGGTPPNPNPATAPPPVLTQAPPANAPPSTPVPTAAAAFQTLGSAAQPPAQTAPPPAAAVPQQAPSPAVSDRPYQDIVRLKQAGFSDEFLLNKVREENLAYHLTTPDILDLRAAGISEPVIVAMMRSGQPPELTAGTPVARRGEFEGLARVGKGFIVFGTSTSKHEGKLVVEGDKISWYQAEDPKKNFSIYAKNVKEIFNTCVLRPGQNLCLELGIVTFTGEEYRFRDPGWKNGDNHLVTEATTYFRQVFPALFFTQRAVKEL